MSAFDRFSRLLPRWRRQVPRYDPPHHRLGFRLALPDFHDGKAHVAQLACDPAISSSVRLEFREPELHIALGRRRSAASGMPVPEASMYEYGPLVASVGDVGRTRQVAVSHAIVVPHLRQYFANCPLRLGVLLAYPTEPGGSLGVGLESRFGRRCHGSNARACVVAPQDRPYDSARWASNAGINPSR